MKVLKGQVRLIHRDVCCDHKARFGADVSRCLLGPQTDAPSISDRSRRRFTSLVWAWPDGFLEKTCCDPRFGDDPLKPALRFRFAL
jgi:hypothetical protein